ncbi:MAG: DUF881 domain-containing protein, partial [Clostridiales bacterium]|nr:DUF881 domain-containing protein [Clostridiales bacterium]
MKMTHVQIAIGSVCLIMAFGVTLQIRSVSYNRVNNVDTARAEYIQQQLRIERDKNDALTEQVLQLKDDLDEFKAESIASSDYSTVLSRQLERAEVLAGLTPVEGSGIIISLRDSRASNDAGLDPNLYVVHDTDILWLI